MSTKLGAIHIVELVYDENGNLVEDEAGRLMAYDELNRLRSVSTYAS